MKQFSASKVIEFIELIIENSLMVKSVNLARQMSNSPIKYMVQLDGLRAFAVGLVILAHWTLNLPVLPKIPLGEMGIELFFVLSGFLISSILLKTKNQGNNGIVLKNFYTRRALRIFPVYYVVLFAIYNWGDLWITDLRVSELIIWHSTYTNNIFYFINGNFWGIESHFWTLSVEEQFYLVWPFIILFTPQKRLKQIIISLLFASILFRAILVANDFLFVRTLMPSQIFAFAMGALLALLHIEDPNKKLAFLQFNKPYFWIAIVLFVTLLFGHILKYGEGIYQIFGEPLMAFVFWAIIAKAKSGFSGKLGKILQWSPVVYIGKISYGIYIFHNFAPSLVKNLGIYLGFEPYLLSISNSYGWESHLVLTLCIQLIFTIAISILSWELMERPILSLKRFVDYKIPTKTILKNHE